MSVISISLLILLGILLILIELLIIPGITVAGIAGFLFIGGGVFLGYHYHGSTTGNYMLAGTFVSSILIVVLALKLKTWQRFGLKTTIDSKIDKLENADVNTGDEGLTVSRLAPGGKALIGDKLFEVRSEGSYIDEHVKVNVTRISGNRIFVEPKN